MSKYLLILRFFFLLFWQMVLTFSRTVNKLKRLFLLFLNIKSSFIYINILHCYCVDKCEMCYIIKTRTLTCTIIH